MSDMNDKLMCHACGEEDTNDQAVECSHCKIMFHKKCVVINDNMTTWNCMKCKMQSAPPAPRSHRSKSVVSRASTSTSQKLALMKLEEEKRLMQKSIDEKIQLEKDFLDKKYEILNQEGSRASGSVVSSKQKVEKWFTDNENIVNSNKAQPLSSTVVNIANTEKGDIQEKTSSKNIPDTAAQPIDLTTNENSNYGAISKYPECPTFNVPALKKSSINHPQATPGFATVADPNVIVNAAVIPKASSYSTFTAPIFMRPSDNQPKGSVAFEAVHHSIQNNEPCSDRSITQNHDISKGAIAARHVIPKELPEFSGNPAQWPEFIGAYNFTSQVCEITEYENAGRLQKYLKGTAFNAVKHTLYLPNGASKAIETLRKLFGQPEFVINELLEDIRRSEKPEFGDDDSIIKFSLKVENLCASITSASLTDHFKNPMLLQELTNYLPTNFKYEWAQHKYKYHSSSIEDFGFWLREKANAILKTLNRAPFQEDNERLNVHINSESKLCVACNKSCPALKECKTFIEANLSKRWDIVKENNICRTCLATHRGVCYVKDKCGINECQYGHNRLLHNYRKSNQPISSNPGTSPNNVNVHKEHNKTTYFKIVPITLSTHEKKISTYAILDDCSSITLLEQGLADELNLCGRPLPLHLKWTGGTTRVEESSKLVGVEISGSNPDKKFKMDRVRTVPALNLPAQTQCEGDFKHFSHLKGVHVPLFNNAVPRMLIGLSHAKLLSTSNIKIGNDDEPLAAKTPLGWVIYGGSEMPCNRVLHINEISANEFLDGQLRDYFSLESLGITQQSQSHITSADDERANNIMQSTTRFKGSFYETGLLWRFDKIFFPNSLQMAKNRLLCLEKKLHKDSKLMELVQGQIEDYIKKGYSRFLTEEEKQIDEKLCWYLPVFVVCNANKPNKTRLVWDAAATVNNISLNSMLLKGTDTLTSLPGILRRFREKKVAFTGDIKEMFHQVHIRKEDQNFQRFLWRFGKDEQPRTLVMNVMTFGATCSPASANYVLNLNGSRFHDQYPEAVDSIKRSHYVDDLLECRDTISDAIQLAREIRYIHKEGGFTIRNWSSNSKEFLMALNEEPSQNCNIEIQTDSIEKVLGLWWDTNQDAFTFLLKYNKANKEILKGESVPTKRDVLRTLMSIFDPLGLLSHILIYPRILLQDIWRAGISWDEEIPPKLFAEWKAWIIQLPSIENISIPRCYQIQHDSTIEIHTFVDASEDAFACVVYARICTTTKVHCVLLGAKSKVAPLKPLSMPRMELQAALIGARITASIKREQNFRIIGEVYWSDSVTVLSWLRSDARRYRQFVAVRIGEILDLSSISSWRYIPSKLNPADLATRKTVHNNAANCLWFQGPSFLYYPQSEWPKHKFNDIELQEIRNQYKVEIVNVHVEALVNFMNQSNWLRVRRAQAYVFRFIHNCKSKSKLISESFRTGPILQCEYKAAQNALFKTCQLEGYPEEIACLSQNPSIQPPKASIIYQDAPYLDTNGVMRSNSRLSNAMDIPEEIKRPIILPKIHPITHLLLMYYHTKYHHVNSETAINEIRQLYIIPALRTLMKSIAYRCQFCKNKRASPKTPFMANLPTARLASFTRPFSYVGIDFFGPMFVRVRRTNEKRWGVIITCLSVRAIHIEIAANLTTDSCIMCIQRFACRRGMPLAFYSDNGKNLIGASKELKAAMESINQLAFSEKFNSESCQWYFNPPSAPHMGGSWERLIRSIKITLNTITPTRTPSEELLNTMLHEVENIINSRPLTYVPLDNELDEAITPNHFLLGSSNGKKPMGEFNSNVWLLKSNWKRCEEFSNRIWKQWRKIYLPELRRRKTFNEHQRNVKVGDVAILCDDDLPKNHWPKAIILSTYPSNDGIVRKATIRTSKGIYVRPVSKLAILDVGSNNSTTSDTFVVPGGTVATRAIQPNRITATNTPTL